MNSEVGDILLTRLCAFLGVYCVRVPEAGRLGERRPDFLITGSDSSRFYAEVKTITPSSAESEKIDRILHAEVVVSGGTPGERLRGLIQKGNKQLKAVAADGHPGVLVVFNPEIFLQWHTAPYHVLTAMRGIDVVDVSVPMDPRVRPRFGDLRSGPRRQMTPDSNTTTSAVIVPKEIEAGVWDINVFHNRFAVRPLPCAALAHSGVRHWSISEDERSWVQL